MRIIETDNFDGDYPDEKFVNLPPMSQSGANRVADAINSALCVGSHASRWWRVVPDDYKLRPGFEP